MEQEHLGGSSSTIAISMSLSNLLQEAQRYAEVSPIYICGIYIAQLGPTCH